MFNMGVHDIMYRSPGLKGTLPTEKSCKLPSGILITTFISYLKIVSQYYWLGTFWAWVKVSKLFLFLPFVFACLLIFSPLFLFSLTFSPLFILFPLLPNIITPVLFPFLFNSSLHVRARLVSAPWYRCYLFWIHVFVLVPISEPAKGHKSIPESGGCWTEKLSATQLR